MLCDVSAILKTEGASVILDSKVDFPNTALPEGEPVFNDDVYVKGTITNVGDVLELEANVSGTFRVPCARCMKELVREFDIDFSETLVSSMDGVSDRDAVVLFEGHTIDLSEIIESNILVNLSFRYLCKEDCKGLCPVCGADLNTTVCHCERDEIDPRMAGLKKLLEEK